MSIYARRILFEINSDNVLILKRKMIINHQPYEVGDEFHDETFNFPFENPQDFFYIFDPLKVGDTLKGWRTHK